MKKDFILKYALLNAIQHDGKADIQAVLGKMISEDPKVRDKIKEIIPEIKKTVKEVNSLSLDRQKNKIKELGFEVEKKRLKKKKNYLHYRT